MSLCTVTGDEAANGWESIAEVERERLVVSGVGAMVVSSIEQCHGAISKLEYAPHENLYIQLCM